MQTIRVETPSAKYDVLAGSELIESLAPRIERVAGRLPRRVFVLTSAPIWALWGQCLLQSFQDAPVVLFLEPGEKYKSLASVERLLRQMAAGGRRSRQPADCLWRRDCGRRGRVSGGDFHARDSLHSGADHVCWRRWILQWAARRA